MNKLSDNFCTHSNMHQLDRCIAKDKNDRNWWMLAHFYICTDCQSIFAFDDDDFEPTGDPMPVDYWGKRGEFTFQGRRYQWIDATDKYYKYQIEMDIAQ